MMNLHKRLMICALATGLLIALSLPSYGAGDAKKGRRKYAEYCTPCHGKNGEGDGTRMKIERFDPPPRNHTDGNVMNKRSDIQLFKTIKEGGKSMNFSHVMPQWKHILSDKDIWNIIAYVRSLAKPPWTGKVIPADAPPAPAAK